MRLRVILLLLLGLTAWSADADTYWYEYNPKAGKLPEEAGWNRDWGNYEGSHKGPGAIRTFEDGALRYDSLYDPGVYDFNYISRPGAVDPKNPGEYFVMEWRLRVMKVIGSGFWDPSIGVFGDESWLVGFGFAEDRIYSVFENLLQIPITPHVFHDYRLVSEYAQLRAVHRWSVGSGGGFFSSRKLFPF